MTKRLLTIYKILNKAYGPQHWWPAESPFEVIVGAILTQNTAWANVELAIERLKKENLLSAKRMSRVTSKVLAECLIPAGYFNVKAKRIKNFLSFLDLEYQGDIGKLFSEPLLTLRKKLLDVNGIGPETADSIILYAAKKPAFVVDAYTKRIFSRMGLIAPSASYDETRDYFIGNLPRNIKTFNQYHALIVEHAKRCCRVTPLCGPCLLRPNCKHGKKE